MPCIATLLRRKGSNLWDLQRFMVEGINADLITQGRKSPNPAHKNFFNVAFNSGSYATTRHSIYTKLQSLLNNTTFSNMVARESTIDLEHAINS